MDRQTNGLVDWAKEFLNPPTLIWAAIIVAGLFMWGSRIASHQEEQDKDIAKLGDEIKNLRAEHKADLRDHELDDDKRQARVRQETNEQDARLWQDVNQLRERVLQNTLLIGEAVGRQAK